MSNLNESILLKKTFYQPWWVTLLRGAFLLLFGLFATIWPAQTVVALVRLAGVYFLVDGIFILFMSIANKKHDLRWSSTMIRSGVGIIVGAFILIAPAFTAAAAGVALVYILAVLSLIHGVMDFLKAFRAKKDTRQEGAIILSAVFFIILAVLLFLAPLRVGTAFIRIIGIVALAISIGFIYSAIRQKIRVD